MWYLLNKLRLKQDIVGNNILKEYKGCQYETPRAYPLTETLKRLIKTVTINFFRTVKDNQRFTATK